MLNMLCAILQFCKPEAQEYAACAKQTTQIDRSLGLFRLFCTRFRGEDKLLLLQKLTGGLLSGEVPAPSLMHLQHELHLSIQPASSPDIASIHW